MHELNIKGLDKAKVLQALYNNARAQGLGILHFEPGELPYEEAKQLVEATSHRFDYLKGRVLKVNVNEDKMRVDLYDHDNGPNAAERALTSMFPEHDFHKE